MKRLQRAAERACRGRGPAHDFLHVVRVTALAKRIAREEGADADVAGTAALLHELVNHPKGSARAKRSGEDAARAAARLLRGERLREAVCACIRDHAFSKGVVPRTLEGRVLQDADRLDAIGAIGVARWAATCTEMARPFYDPGDPFCEKRAPDDALWGLDHFYRKLLRIRFHTRSARAIARQRAAFLRRFLAQLRSELRDGRARTRSRRTRGTGRAGRSARRGGGRRTLRRR